jgi:TatD DNase family protein
MGTAAFFAASLSLLLGALMSQYCLSRKLFHTSLSKCLPHGRNIVMSATNNSSQASGSSKSRYIDIGINLTDPIFAGNYHGHQRHAPDLKAILERARDAGCEKLIVTGSSLSESKKAVALCQIAPGLIYSTIGVHPCSSLEFTKDQTCAEGHLEQLKSLALSAKESGECVAFGEIGLDYDRLTLCPRDVQLEYFARQLDIAIEVGLPLFLHSRAAHDDFKMLLKERLEKLPKRGVVHSFTGTEAEMLELVELGFDIGINGCSMKTQENIDVVKQVPLDRIQLETDGPWCEMRPSHASAQFTKDYKEPWKSVKREKWNEGSMVKGRNEPCTIPRVAVAVAAIKGIDLEVLTNAAWNNTMKMFSLQAQSNLVDESKLAEFLTKYNEAM